jgi:hypothetical protein
MSRFSFDSLLRDDSQCGQHGYSGTIFHIYYDIYRVECSSW